MSHGGRRRHGEIIIAYDVRCEQEPARWNDVPAKNAASEPTPAS
jgi:hypothetical protein